MEKNSLNQNLHQVGGIGNLVVDNPEDVLRGAANFTGISGKAMLEEMSRSHSNLVAIGGSEGYTGAETSGGGADPDEVPATGPIETGSAGNKPEPGKTDRQQTGNRTGTSGDEEATAGDNEAGGTGAP